MDVLIFDDCIDGRFSGHVYVVGNLACFRVDRFWLVVLQPSASSDMGSDEQCDSHGCSTLRIYGGDARTFRTGRKAP